MMFNQLGFQNPFSYSMTLLEFFYDKIMMIIIFISIYVMMIFFILFKYNYYIKIDNENHYLEVFWTFLPMLILIIMALPSLRLLYLMEENSSEFLVIKTIGHQWYWSYDYADFKNIEFDSFMILEKNLEHIGMFRLLETDNSMVIPYGIEIRLMVTSDDVIHSWTVPSLGVKVDAVPGRLNQLIFTALRSGTLYGQCSEICGVNHSFMPINVEIVNLISWENWVLTKLI